MKPKEIQEILEFITQSGLDEVNIETDQFKLAVKRNAAVQQVVSMSAPVSSAPVQAPVAASAPAAASTTPSAPAAPSAAEARYVTIKSPMIGTFYKSPGPDSDAFCNVGDAVSVGTTVCIIEAMKLFNEIESEVSGKIVKILVENATPVEYDQPLYLVDPS